MEFVMVPMIMEFQWNVPLAAHTIRLVYLFIGTVIPIQRTNGVCISVLLIFLILFGVIVLLIIVMKATNVLANYMYDACLISLKTMYIHVFMCTLNLLL